jgi:hypothetical protein
MSYSILQSTLEIPSVEKLKVAFQSVSCLTNLDAQHLAKDAYGILVRNLDKADAGTLHQALAGQGIETKIVPDNQVPAVPHGKIIQRMDVSPESLVLYDPLGRPFSLPWEHVMLVAAGRVRMSEFKRVRKEHVITQADAFGNPYTEVEVDYSTREEQNYHLLLEIVLTGAVIRYLVNGSKFNFQYLGNRLQENLTGNFSLLVQDICQRAPHAVLNRGAYHFRGKSDEPFLYPSKNAFYEEFTWLLWRMK